MSITLRYLLIFLFDFLAVVVAWLGSYLIRFNFQWPVEYQHQILLGILPLLVLQVVSCKWVGLYRGMWMFASLADLKRVIFAVAISSFGLLAFGAFAMASQTVPRSVLLLYPILLVLIMGGGRAIWRMLREQQMYGALSDEGKPVVVVGAGTGGAMLVKALEHSPDWHVVGLVDDDESKWGLEIFGRRVLGATERLVEVLESYGAHHVIFAMPSAGASVLRRVTELAVNAGARVFTVPALAELMSGRVAINTMRPVRIEDLLGREPVNIDANNVAQMLERKVILVTGAGGSIGSELCRQLVQYSPTCILLVDSSEFALYMIEQWFTQYAKDIRVVSLMGDVKDADRMNEIFLLYQPQVVFHAAAYKHVPLVEVGNAWQAVRNNVLGTLTVAQCSQRYDVERFVLISTDKAVNPTNVMGATKRLAEMLCEALHTMKRGTTVFQMVRFGNVLGSTGSVIPKFQAQIAAGGPVTVTHPEINRYFMSIPEAAQLVLQAATMGLGGEIFVLDMGEPVKIVDMARNMIRLSGYSEDEIHIEFTGLRPGEKLYEELLADAEQTLETPHDKLRIARSRPVPELFLTEIIAWLIESTSHSDEEVRMSLLRWVPEYAPQVNREH
ncbi:nucleoside-diphosphate sugar epimerase/dehydratase [Paralcaligenes ginsengisoli]